MEINKFILSILFSLILIPFVSASFGYNSNVNSFGYNKIQENKVNSCTCTINGSSGNGTDTWASNYTFYYNKSQIDNNFTLYALNSSLNNYAPNTTLGIQSLVNNSINYSSYCGIPNSVYNSTYSTTSIEWNGNKSALIGCVNNASYLSTSNATYSNLLNQNCPNGKIVNGTYANGTFICTDQTGGAGSNPFNQNLNTTDNAKFSNINLTNIGTDNSLINIINSSGNAVSVLSSGEAGDTWLINDANFLGLSGSLGIGLLGVSGIQPQADDSGVDAYLQYDWNVTKSLWVTKNLTVGSNLCLGGTCVTSLSSGNMNYTNLALTNKSNNFAGGLNATNFTIGTSTILNSSGLFGNWNGSSLYYLLSNPNAYINFTNLTNFGSNYFNGSGWFNTTGGIKTSGFTMNSNINGTGNITTTGLVTIKQMTIPACGTAYNGSIASNSTSIYFCNGTNWNMMTSVNITSTTTTTNMTRLFTKLANNVSTTNSTWYNQTAFTLSLSANKNYTVECLLVTQTSSQPTACYVNMSFPSSNTLLNLDAVTTTTPTYEQSSCYGTKTECDWTPSSTLVAPGSMVKVIGRIEVGSSGGNLNVAIKSETGSTTTVQMNKGSYCGLWVEP